MSLNVITASAGSGKTFRLTTEYLKLSLTKPPSYFSRILGITFTNKAANEMKENILKELDLLVKNPKKSDQLDHLKYLPEFGGDEEKLKEKAALVQRNILLAYHDFSLTTIDSFFQRIIRAFFRDLGLASNFDVELNTDQVVSDALNDYLKKMRADDPLMQIIGNIQEDLIRESKSPNYKKELKKLSREIFKEHQLPDTRKNSKRFREIKSELHQYINTADETFEIYKEETRKILEEYDLELNDFSGKAKSSFLAYFFNRAKNKAYEIPTGSNWLKALESVDAWYAKTAPPSIKQQIIASSNELMPLIQNVHEHLVETKENYFSNKEIIKSYNSFEAISYLKAIVRDYIKENNIFLLGETYEMLKDFLKETDSPLVYERIGNRYNHIFVDEFQDTSRYQYDNIRPLISENMASGDSNLVVGDIKQAIYRFRNGDWRMLKYDVHEDFQDIVQDNLSDNFRSDLHIVEFNNALFEFLPEKISEVLDLKIGNSIPDWSQMKESKAIKEIYADAKQDFPADKPKIPGYVQMEFFSNGSKKEEFEAQLFRRMEDELLDLEKRGFRPGQIAMLTRTRTEGRKLIEWLTEMQAKHPQSKIFEFFSEEVLSIGDSPAVETVVSLMKLALLGKSDQRYKQLLLLQFSHFSKKAGLSSALHKNEAGLFIDNSGEIPEDIGDLISTGIQLGLKGLYSNIIAGLGLGVESMDKHFYYLSAFADEIDEYHKKSGDDLAGFLKYWDEEGREKNVEPPSSPDKISIMTVHKSKGLAFDVVFMPFAGVDLMPKSSTIIWVEDDRFMDDNGNAQMFPITASSSAEKTRFKREYWTEVLYNWLDQLNVFYVGCTRPRNALFIYAFDNIGIKNEDSLIPFLKTFASNKLKQLDLPPTEHEDIEVYTYGENARENLIPKSSKESPNNTFSLDNYHSAQLLPQIKTTGIKTGIASAEASDRTAIEEGLLMHRILELVIRKSDLPKALLQVIEEGHMAESEYDEWKSRIHTAFSLHPVANWFEDGIEVLNERDILLPDGRRYRPDRIVLKGNKAIVIDYKTGRPYAHYQKQMGVYCSVLREMGYDETEAWLFYTDAMKTEKVN